MYKTEKERQRDRKSEAHTQKYMHALCVRLTFAVPPPFYPADDCLTRAWAAHTHTKDT